MTSNTTESTNTPPKPDLTAPYTSFLHTTSLALLFLSPILIALPPRKLDLYTFGLGGAWIASANHLTQERTGRSIIGQLSRGRSQDGSVRKEGQRLLELPAEQQQQPQQIRSSRSPRQTTPVAFPPAESPITSPPVLGTTDWKQRRLAEEQSKLDSGEGYGSMIMDQIWEVWNWDKRKMEDVKAKDEEVVRQRRDEEDSVIKNRRREEEFPRIGKGASG